jgi:hypothetical protein
MARMDLRGGRRIVWERLRLGVWGSWSLILWASFSLLI